MVNCLCSCSTGLTEKSYPHCSESVWGGELARLLEAFIRLTDNYFNVQFQKYKQAIQEATNASVKSINH